MYFARQRHKVTGIDFLEEPLQRAKRKAAEPGVSVTFLVKDATTLNDWWERFDNVIDCGLFHVQGRAEGVVCRDSEGAMILSKTPPMHDRRFRPHTSLAVDRKCRLFPRWFSTHSKEGEKMKHAGFITVPVLLCWLAAGIPAITAAEHTKDSLATVKKNLAARKAVLVDVREKAEWDDGHLRDAALLPLSEIPGRVSDKKLEKQFPKGTVLYLHCASGRRCLKAADILMKNGYDVRPLREGYEALLKKGFPKK